ncbi:crotonase/enoyl-CoA hydratase family protein [Polaromonas sp. P1-6]|nr:crotonase/enoyl-CoA hydratase family protein [Polaromonas sp. P1-6]
MSSYIKFEQQGAIVTLTLNRPEIRNALTGAEDGDEIVEACRLINANQDIRAVILTGAGSCFCAGGDLSRMRDTLGMGLGEPTRSRQAYRSGIQRIPLALQGLEVPTIAAVNGPAIGAGCDLATMCDIRIASATATFAESFVKVGLVPGDGGAWLLPRAVGMSRACEMAFTGDAIDAQQALAYGLVSRVVEPGQLMTEANLLAGRIAQNPGQVLRLTKRLMLEGQHTRLDTLLEMSASFQAMAHWTVEHNDAVNAFLDKRTQATRS